MGIRVLVTGAGSGVGQSVIKSLRMSDMRVEIIGMDSSPLNVGVYSCDKGYLGLRAEHSRYGEQLVEIIKREQIDALFVGTDTELPIISEMRNMIEELGCLPIVGSVHSSRVARNKLDCANFFHAHGFPFAKTVYLKDMESFINDVGFPVIVKPVDGSGSAGVRAAMSPDELRSETQARSGYDTILQEFLVPRSWGKDRNSVTTDDLYKNGFLNQTDEVSIQVLVGESDILGCFISHNQLKAGYPMKVVPVRDSYLETLAVQIAEEFMAIGLVGPLNLQCRLTEDGPVFFEVNPRFTGITGMRAGMGFNECTSILRHLLFKEPADRIQQSLVVSDEWVCARYMTEVLIRKDDVDGFRNAGVTLARGRALSL